MLFLMNELNNFFSNQGVVVLLFVFLAVATYTDLKSLKIYNKFNLIFLISRFALFTYLPLTFNHFLGALVGFLVLTIPAVHLMHKMGGDIKFITVLGLFLGLPLTIALLALSCMYMLIFSLFKKLTKKINVKKVLVPFAPFFMISFLTLFIISYII